MILWQGKKEWFLIRSKEGMILSDGKKSNDFMTMRISI